MKSCPCNFLQNEVLTTEIRVDPESILLSWPPFLLSQPEMDELKEPLEELLSDGFIEQSSSTYDVPVFFVKKKDESLRLVCDWRAMNKITAKVQACLPSTENLFDTV